MKCVEYETIEVLIRKIWNQIKYFKKSKFRATLSGFTLKSLNEFIL